MINKGREGCSAAGGSGASIYTYFEVYTCDGYYTLNVSKGRVGVSSRQEINEERKEEVKCTCSDDVSCTCSGFTSLQAALFFGFVTNMLHDT